MDNFSHICHRGQGLQDLHSCTFCESWWLKDGENQIGAPTDGREKSGHGHFESLQSPGQSTLTPAAPCSNKQVRHVEVLLCGTNRDMGRSEDTKRSHSEKQECTASKRQRKTKERRVIQGRKMWRGDRIKICRKLSSVSSIAHKIILLYLGFSE